MDGCRIVMVVAVIRWSSVAGRVSGGSSLIEVMMAEGNDEVQGKRHERKPCP